LSGVNNQKLTRYSADSFVKVQSVRSKRYAEPTESAGDKWQIQIFVWKCLLTTKSSLDTTGTSISSSLNRSSRPYLESGTIIFKPDCILCRITGSKIAIYYYSNIPAAPAYGVYISQLIRYSRACSFYQDFPDRGLLLTRRLLNQGFLLVKLNSSLRKFSGRHHDLVDCYGISVSQMTTDRFHLSFHFSVLSSMTYHRVCN
jgi:hypothetical protein